MPLTAGLETEVKRLRAAQKVRRVLRHCKEVTRILSEVDAVDVAALLIAVGNASSLAAIDQAARDLAHLRDMSR